MVEGQRNEPAVKADIAYLKHHWAILAAEAWQGYCELGRGVLLMDFTADHNRLAYYCISMRTDARSSDWPTPTIAAQVSSYNPQSDVLFLIFRRSLLLSTYRLSSPSLPPPIAYARRRSTIPALAA